MKPTNIHEAEAMLHDIVAAQINRETLVASRDAELQTVNELHNPGIEVCDSYITERMAALEQWADASPEVFGKLRSAVIGGHRLGYRTGNPTVKPRGKTTLANVLLRLIEKGGELAAKYVRRKPELDKDAILAAARDTKSADDDTAAQAMAELAEVGVRVVQGETFFVNPNREGQADKTLKGEA